MWPAEHFVFVAFYLIFFFSFFPFTRDQQHFAHDGGFISSCKTSLTLWTFKVESNGFLIKRTVWYHYKSHVPFFLVVFFGGVFIFSVMSSLIQIATETYAVRNIDQRVSLFLHMMVHHFEAEEDLCVLCAQPKAVLRMWMLSCCRGTPPPGGSGLRWNPLFFFFFN